VGRKPGKGKRFFFIGLAAVSLLSPALRSSAADVRVVTRADGLPSDWVTALAAGDDGVWAGTLDAGVARLSPGGEVDRVYGTRDGLPAPRITSLAFFGTNLYAGTADGLAVFDGFSWDIVREAGNVLLRNVVLRTEPKGTRLWLGAVNTSGGLLRFDGNTWQDMGGEGRGPLNHVQAFAFQGDVAWLGSMNSGVYRKTDTEFQYFVTKDGLPSANVTSLETFEGSVWAGTSRGPAKFEDGRWVSYRKPGVFPMSAVFCLAASPKALYLGGREGLARYRNGRFEMLRAKIDDSPLRIGRVNALLVRGDTVYAGTSSGLLEIKGW
jgi:ligand-binding sensor domain-containing protein